MTLRTSTPYIISGTSPAAAGQAILGSVVVGLARFDSLQFDALIAGATGGTLDVYLQRKLATDVWLDFAHFPVVLAAASQEAFSLSCDASQQGVTRVGKTDDLGTTGAPFLAAGSSLGGHPGNTVRAVCVAGTGTSAGGAVTIYINGYTQFG